MRLTEPPSGADPDADRDHQPTELELGHPPPRNHLPAAISNLVGRQHERLAVAELLDRSRLVTLTGPGGMGKTRLAIEVAEWRSGTLGQPAAFVDLSPIADPTLLPHAVAAALDVREEHGSVLDALVGHLRRRESLLVLDNCEHLIDACAVVADHLLHACAPLRVLATSRERLAITGEVAWAVPPLSLPRPSDRSPEALAGSEAVRLFCDRAAAVRPGFALDTTNASAVADICRRLDGNALALELAGARADVLSPAEIADHLGDRFAILVMGSRTATPRQKTLKGALEWSHDLLSAPQRALLRRLSVFAGSFTLAAARDVCGGGGVPRADVLDLMSRLVAKSLVVADTRPPVTRYRLLESIREYARQHLVEAGELDQMQALQAAWCVVALEESARHGPRAGRADDWVDAFEAEQDNVRTALEWALGQGRAKLALRLTRAQMTFWELRGLYGEAREWLERALLMSERAPEGLRAAALHDAGLVAMMLGDLDAARNHLEQSLALPSTRADPRSSARSRNLLGFVSTFTGDGATVEDLEAALPELAATGDDACLAESLAACGRARMFKGEAVPATAHFERAVELARLVENESQVAGGLVGLGWAAVARGAYGEAEARLTDALALADSLSDDHTRAMARCWMAELARLQDHVDTARAGFTESLAVARRMAAPHPVARCLLGLGWLALEDGDDDEGARQRFDEAADVARGAGLAQVLAASLVGLGEAAGAQHGAVAARRLFEEAVTVAKGVGDRAGAALAQYGLGRWARGAGDVELAASSHFDALATRNEIADRAGISASLEAVAGVTVLRGNEEHAARLFGAAQGVRERVGHPRPRREQEAYDADVALLRERMGVEDLEQAWAEGAALTIDDAVSYALRGRGRRGQTRGWAGLTKVEQDVVALVEQGLTNVEIAERLLVSRETVKTHMSRVFAKVGVNSRQALRDVARRRMTA